MKALILSDLHSNIYALEAIWAQEQDSDVVYCAGDLVDSGPFPHEVLDWVRDRHVVCVQGNHDRDVVRCYRTGMTAAHVPVVERRWSQYNAGLLHEDDIVFLEQLPMAVSFTLDDVRYGITHFYQDYNEIVSLDVYTRFRVETFADGDTPLPTRLIFGHTHRQAVRYLSDTLLWLNPGSISYRRPDDPDQTAHYITLTDGVISLRRLAYDLEPIWRAARAVALTESEAQAAERFFPGPSTGLSR